MRELLNTGVNISLEYHDSYDALIGQIKGYSVAVKENLSTGSYGCLFWVRKGEFGTLTTAEQYLEEQQKKNPEFLKKFMVNDTGVAVALVRSSDDFVNVNNLKRFIYDFTTSLSRNNYVNCCCECGKTDGLGIYDAGGAIAQACSSCGEKYKFICACDDSPSAPLFSFGTPAAEETSAAAVVTPVETPVESEGVAELPVAEAKTEEAASLSVAETESALVEVSAVPTKEDKTVSEEEKAESIFAEFEYKPEEKTVEPAPVVDSPSEEEEFSLKEFEYNPDEKVEETPEPVVEEKTADLSALMYDESDKEETPETQAAEPVADNSSEENFDAFLYEGEKPEPERPRSRLFEEAEREFAAEKARMAAEEAERGNDIDNLLIEDGEIVLKEIAPESDDGSHDVTEVYDDSNDGEDFDIEEIESTVEMPTVTTGHPQLEAEETPLEEDGSVPLINPNSHREERHVSPADGPDAVLPLDYGQANITYEKLSEETAPRFSAGGEVNRGQSSQTPPAYNPDMSYSSYTKKISYADESNAFIGIIGAFVLGLVGLVVWLGFAHFLDVISVWGCLAIIFTVYGGYYLGGRSLDKKGIVISFILTLLMVFAGVVGMSVLNVMSDLKEEYDLAISFADAFKWSVEAMSFESSRNAFVTNLIISMAATLIGDIVAAVSLWKKA